jgi:type IV pilus assembly protein PilC
MAEFVCRLGTPAGDVITRTVEASGVQEARTHLEHEGFRVFAVTSPSKGGISKLSMGGGARTRVKASDFLLFNQQLAALLRAGIPILQAITMLRKRAASAGLRAVLGEVEDAIRGGAALSAAFAAQGPIFPRIYTASILAGERSGALDEVLSRYVAYMRRNVQIRRKIRGALAYPAFLLIASFGMVSFLSVYVVPRMSELFQGLNANSKLPTITIIVVGISSVLSKNIIWIAPLAIAGGVAFFLWSRTVNGRMTIDRVLLKIPLIGRLLVQISIAQATRSLATLLAGGITLVESWEIAGESITNRELRRKSTEIIPMVREGRSFTDSLEAAEWIPELALDMIGIGERSGSLREMLDEVAAFYDAESEVKLEQLTTTLEPAILVVMGGVVITILLAIYLPIIQSISSGPMSGR